MKKIKSKNNKKIWLVVALVVVVAGGIIFMGAVSGWFGEKKITLDAEMYSDTPEIIEIDGEKYNELIFAGKSFVLLVDQGGCVTADRLRNYMLDYAQEKGINVYKIMFGEIKDLSLHDYIKYYPSTVLVGNGKVRAYLRADSDGDAEMYNNYDAFKGWMERYL